MTKTMTYKTAKGTEITVEVTYEKQGNGFDLDGYEVESTETTTYFEVRFLGLGKELASSKNINFCKTFNNTNQPDKAFVCDRLLFPAKEKENIDKFIEQVIAEYEEPAKLAGLKHTEKKPVEVKEEEIDVERTKRYNDLYNEGGEGYVPTFKLN